MISTLAALEELKGSVIEERRPSIDAIVSLMVSRQMVLGVLRDCKTYFDSLDPCPTSCVLMRSMVGIMLEKESQP